MGEANFFGKVKSLRWNLCYGGTPAEATLFAEHVGKVASRFPANIVDPQIGGVVGNARAEIPAKWLEANLWSLGNYEEGRWEVRSPRGYTRLPDGKLTLVEALAGPHRVNNLLTVACGYSRVQDYERANRVMETVLEEDPELPAAHFLLAIGHSQLGKLDAARRHLKETLRLDPQHQAAREVLQELGAAKG